LLRTEVIQSQRFGLLTRGFDELFPGFIVVRKTCHDHTNTNALGLKDNFLKYLFELCSTLFGYM
jgi:hypothetical protein